VIDAGGDIVGEIRRQVAVRLLRTFIALVMLVAADSTQAADLAGLRRDGNSFTYELGKLKFDGILLLPSGEGPFPAVLVSHGLGGSAESFGLQKARELTKRDYACIAPNYTHNRQAAGRGPRVMSGRPSVPADEELRKSFGASSENIDRAAKCVEILKSLPQIDSKRVYAYGHSMGGFVTIGLVAREPKLLNAAAISGSGISMRPGYPAPTAEQAAKIRTPLVMFHGADDTTVRPEQSAALRQTLDANEVPCERHVYEGVGHPVDQQKASEMYDRIHAWFEKYASTKK
jgi:dienelactone hydrolase